MNCEYHLGISVLAVLVAVCNFDLSITPTSLMLYALG